MPVKMTLRKANALQSVIQSAINSITVKIVVDLNEFQDISTELQRANDAAMAADVRRSDLLMSLYTLRSLVGRANAQVGISDHLSHGAFIDKRIAQLADFASDAAVLTDGAVIQGKLDKIRNRVDASRADFYGRQDSVTTGVLTQTQSDTINGVVRELRKQKQDLNDKILELNIKTEVELTPEVESILVHEGII